MRRGLGLRILGVVGRAMWEVGLHQDTPVEDIRMAAEAAYTALAVDMVLGKDMPCWKRVDGLNRRLLQYLPDDYVSVFILLLGDCIIIGSTAIKMELSYCGQMDRQRGKVDV